MAIYLNRGKKVFQRGENMENTTQSGVKVLSYEKMEFGKRKLSEEKKPKKEKVLILSAEHGLIVQEIEVKK